MFDFACSNTISTQTSNIYLNQLQLYGQFADVYMPHVETDWQRSITVVSTNTSPVRTDVPRTLPPLRTPSLEHLQSRADECKTIA